MTTSTPMLTEQVIMQLQRDLAAAQERAEKAEAERDAERKLRELGWSALDCPACGSHLAGKMDNYASLKQHAEAMAEELQWIACRYDDSKSTRECAADAYEMKSAAAQALHAYRAAQEKKP